MNEDLEVRDTYEAAFYLLNGARLKSFRQEAVPGSKLLNRLFHYQWILTLADVPEEISEIWKSRTATANIIDLARARKRIKRFVFDNRGIKL
jgi:hypothetical protein